MPYLSRYFVFVFGCLFGLHAPAQDYAAESDFFGETPMVLTVSRMHKPLEESPASVTVIDRQMIRNSGAREIADIFRMVPGFIVGYKSGGVPAVTYQGFGLEFQRQLQVLIDGRSVFIPSFGGVRWSNLPLLLEDIERVEVTRGPNAVTYGANAFLATINIITRHAAEDLGAKLTVTHDLNQDNHEQGYYFRYGDHYNDLDWRITMGREKDDGYPGIFDSKQLEKLNFRTDFLTARNQFWTIQLGISKGILNEGDGDANDLFREEETVNSYQNIKWELLQEGVSTTLLVTHTRQDLEDNFQSGPLNQQLADALGQPGLTLLPDITTFISFDRLSDRREIELYQNRKLNEQTSIVYGGSIRKDQVKSFYLFNNNETQKVDTERLFSSLEWKSESNLTIDLGLMLEDSNLVSRQTTGRFSIIKDLGAHDLRVVSSTARRNPILLEVKGNIVFNVNLPSPPLPVSTADFVNFRADGSIQPEKIHSTEIGLLSEFIDGQLTTDIKLFHYEIRDHITERSDFTPQNPSEFPTNFNQPINKGKTDVNGIELSFNLSPSRKNYRLYGGFSFNEHETFETDTDKSIPDYSGFVGGHIDLTKNHQVSATYYAMDELSYLDSGDDIPSYQKLDARYRYLFDSRYNLALEIIGTNLIEEYTDYLSENTQERLILVRLSGQI